MRTLVALALSAALGACTTGSPTQVQTVSEPLPELTGVDLHGDRLSTAEFAGSVLVVNAWASWCGPCEQETPMLVRMASRYAAQGVRFVGIDHTDQVAEALAFADRYDVPYPSFSDQAGRFAAVLGYPGLPATFVVDANGTIRYRVFAAPIDEDTLTRLLDDVLGAASSTSPSTAG